MASSADDEGFYEWIPLKSAAAPRAPFEVVGGKRVNLAAFRGKVVVLNLWANWCGPCMNELPTLDALEKEMGGKGLVVVPLSVDELNYSGARRVLDKMELALPHLAKDNDDHSFGVRFGSDGLPATYVIGRDGTMRYKYLGSTDWTDAKQKEKLGGLLAEGQ